jgi:hypothetical protein
VPSLPHPLSYGKKRALLPAGERHENFFDKAEKGRAAIPDILSVLHGTRLLLLNWRKDTTKPKLMQAVASKYVASKYAGSGKGEPAKNRLFHRMFASIVNILII